MRTDKLVIGAAIAAALLFFIAAAPAPVKILLIGDSITVGDGYNYRYLLWNRLLDSGYTNIDFVGNSNAGSYRGGYDWNHESWGGYSTGKMLSSSAGDIASLKPDIAIIHLGSMDINLKLGVSEAANNIKALIANLRNANASVSVILAIIPLGDETWATAYGKLAESITTAQSPVRIVDQKTDWNSSTDTRDGAHVNSRGAEKMSGRFYPVVAEEIAKRVPRGANRKRPVKTEGANIALHAAVTASRAINGREPALAVDGDMFSCWSSGIEVLNAAPPEAKDWLQVDLGSITQISGTAVYWEITGRVIGYKIETRKKTEDSWQIQTDRTNSADTAQPYIGGVDYFKDSVRYVRITVTKLGNGTGQYYNWPAMIREFRIFDLSKNVSTAEISKRGNHAAFQNRSTLLFPMLHAPFVSLPLSQRYNLQGRTISSNTLVQNWPRGVAIIK